jgi:uncharacterized protein (DUF305 family)
MIEHHEGAIEMAKTEQRDGLSIDAIELAESIESSQTAETYSSWAAAVTEPCFTTARKAVSWV